MSKNGERLCQLIAQANMDPDEALTLWNKGRSEPLNKEKWSAYMAKPGTRLWKPCPDSVVMHMESALRQRSERNDAPTE